MHLPAILGGKPARRTFLPHNRPSLESDDIDGVVGALKQNVLSMGGLVEEFERAFAEYIGSKYAVAVSSGSAGLHIALMAAGIGHQEEVICTSLTHPGTTHCILYQKAVPIFTDISPATLNLDPAAIKYRLTQRTRAVIVTHYGGFPCAIKQIQEMAGEGNMILVEDATRALGAEYPGGLKVGAQGDVGVFSFSGLQGVTTGEGGMVVTNDPETHSWLTIFRNSGMVEEKERFSKYPGPWHRETQDLGFNYRLTEMQAALGLSQLSKAERFLTRREEIARQYSAALEGRRELSIPVPPAETRPSWDIYPLRLKLERLNCGRREIFDALVAENIGVDVLYLPVYLHPYYVWIGHPDVCTLTDKLCPNAEEAYESMVCLPIYPAMTDRDVDDVIHALIKVIDHYRR